jgi:hypothetical protein
MVFFKMPFICFNFLNNNLLILYKRHSENMLKKMFSKKKVYGKFFVLL